MEKRFIPDFHLQVSTDPSSGRLLVRLAGAPDLERDVKPSSVESPLRNTYKSEEALGRALYECLFHDEAVRQKFEACRDEHCSGKVEDCVGLRLVLDILTDPGRTEPLLSLPWELLHDGKGWLARDPTLSIVRLLNVRKQDVQKEIHPPLRVLLTCAEPEDKRRFGGEQTLNVIREVIESAIEPLELEPRPHATKKMLEPLIRQGFHFVHFLGHGDVEAEKAQLGLLFLELEKIPSSDILTATELKSWIEGATIRPRLFVLTACHSGNPTGFGFLGVSTALLDAGVEAVVAMQTELYDDEAEAFAEAFYCALGDRLTVDDAMQAGRRALRSHPRPRSLGCDVERFLLITDAFPGWAVPTLFLQGNGWLGQGPPEPLITWAKDKKEMVLIQEGNFYIDKYPVTRQEYRRFASDAGRSVPWRGGGAQALLERFSERLPKDTVWDARLVESLLPATNVELRDALAYAAWAGKHIPTADEWRQAALSGCPDEEWPYPWGPKFAEERCNTRESAHRQPWPVILSEVYNGCNPAGMCDIVGDVAEWTRTDQEQGVLCGGSFKDPAEECTVQRQTWIDAEITGGDVGFRCAATLTEYVQQSEFALRSKEEN